MKTNTRFNICLSIITTVVALLGFKYSIGLLNGSTLQFILAFVFMLGLFYGYTECLKAIWVKVKKEENNEHNK